MTAADEAEDPMLATAARLGARATPSHSDDLSTRIRSGWPLVRTLTVREFRARYRQSALDLAWSLITPLTTLAVYGLIFSLAFKVRGEGVPYLCFVWAGLVVWSVFSSGLTVGSTALLYNADLLSKVYFPREVLPLAMVGTALIDLAIAMAVLVVIVAIQIHAVSISVLAVVPVLLVLVVWTAGIAVLTAAITVFIRDTAQVVQLFLRLAIFTTPVMYGPAVLPRSLRFLVWLNPVAVCITGLRDATLYRRWPEWDLLGVHGVVGLLVLVGSIAYVRSVELRMIDVI